MKMRFAQVPFYRRLPKQWLFALFSADALARPPLLGQLEKR